MVGVLYSAHQDERDVVEIGAVWLLVDRALVELGIARTSLDRVHVDDWKNGEQYFVVRLHQPAGTPIPSCSVQKQTINVHTLLDTNATATDKLLQGQWHLQLLPLYEKSQYFSGKHWL